MTADDAESLTISDKLAFQRTDERYKTVRTLIRTAGWVVGAVILYLIVIELAGKDTTVNVLASMLVSLLVDIKFTLVAVLAVTTTIWAFVERGFRRNKVEALQARIRTLETQIDPGRTSSGLTPRGETNPVDRGDD